MLSIFQTPRQVLVLRVVYRGKEGEKKKRSNYWPRDCVRLGAGPALDRVVVEPPRPHAT